MRNAEKEINRAGIYNYKSNIRNDKFSSPFYTKTFETNAYFPIKTEINRNRNKYNYDNLTYKSVFPKEEKKDKNNVAGKEKKIYGNHNNKNFSNNEQENENYSLESNLVTYLRNKNQSKINKKKQIKNKLNFSKEENSMTNYSEKTPKINNNNTLNRNINIQENYLNNNKIYSQYSLNKNKSVKLNSDILNIENLSNMVPNKNLKEENHLKTENNDDKIFSTINKKDFMKNIKEIDDLNYLDGIDDNIKYASTAENINKLIYNENNFLPLTEVITDGFSILDKVPFIPKNSKVINFNKNNKANNLVINTKDIIKNTSSLNDINENEKKAFLNQQRKYKSKLINHSKKNSYANNCSNNNKSYKNKLTVNLNSFNNNNSNDNSSLFKDKNIFSTTTQRDEQLKRVSKNLSIENKNLIHKKTNQQYSKDKTIKSDNLSNEFTKIMRKNNYIRKIPINSENNVVSELKEQIKQLNNVINNKNNQINNFVNIIKENKEKNEILVKNNNQLNEENKKIKELLIKCRNQIINLTKRKTQKNINNKDLSENNVNINYNYITNNDYTQTKIKELEKEIEKYKKENNQ